MKNLFFTSVFLLGLQANYFGQNCNIEIPAYNILYVGYNNFLVPSGGRNMKLSATGCTVTPATKDGRSGYYVKPSSKGTISIQVTGQDADGNTFSCGTYQYVAKSFPLPEIRNRKISKATGGTIQVAMPQTSPINATFTVLNGEILGVDGGAFSGDSVTADKLKTFEKGSRVGIILTVLNNLTGIQSNINASIIIE